MKSLSLCYKPHKSTPTSLRIKDWDDNYSFKYAILKRNKEEFLIKLGNHPYGFTCILRKVKTKTSLPRYLYNSYFQSEDKLYLLTKEEKDLILI
jgi:hypothetical protein